MNVALIFAGGKGAGDGGFHVGRYSDCRVDIIRLKNSFDWRYKCNAKRPILYLQRNFINI